LTRHVDELVQRRNEVAHGYDTDDLESVEILIERADALAALVNALDEVVAGAASEIEIQTGKAIPLQPVLKVFDNRIVGVKVSGLRVRRGDTLIAKLPGGALRYRRGEIQSIEIDNVDFAEVQPSTPTAIALCVEFFAKENFEYFLLPQ
jgi:translation initiation factor IF-2